MNTKKSLRTLTLLSFVLILSCKKEDEFLSAKPNQALAVPASLNDLQNLLNNESIMNSVDPTLGQITSDDQVTDDASFGVLGLQMERNTYTFQRVLYDASYTQIPDWNRPYAMVYYANTVLGALPGLTTEADESQAARIRGAALFYRAWAFYNLLQSFSMPYDAGTAGTAPGIVLRLSADLNARPQRSTVAECYRQLIADAGQAEKDLPLTPAFKTQPSKPAANALLARIYLAMGRYNDALNMANACLAQYDVLDDYNKLNTPSTIGINNNYISEDIYHSVMGNLSLLTVRRNHYVTPSLYALYDNNDLRRSKFFTILDGLTEKPRIVGSYDHKNGRYTGLATDEVYLIKAECQARANEVTSAMSTLNALLVKRWRTGTFLPLTASSPQEALDKILLERRKELILRGLRWTDLRRLNKDPRYAVTISRTIAGTNYLLPPNDPRYTLPIPDNEISLGGITQNDR